MRMPPKPVVVVAGGLLAALLGTALVFYHINRQLEEDVASGKFREQYAKVINDLYEAIETAELKQNSDSPSPIRLQTPNRSRNTGIRSGTRLSGNLILQGIFWDQNLPLTMINDQICQEGDQIGAYTLQKIHPDRIVLTNLSGETKEIQLREDTP
jgi:hypothetical protein